MNKNLRLLLISSLLLPACALPALAPRATATPIPTSTALPTITPEPPTSTPSPALPSPALPTPALPTAVPGAVIEVTQPALPTAGPLPTAMQPTATIPPPTRAPIEPEGRALFRGSFTGGTLTFRIGELSDRVIPKQVIVKGAECKEGGNINTSVAFDAADSFAIEAERFTIGFGSTVTISGQFQSDTRALGTIRLRVVKGGRTCTVGPLPWVANAE